MLLSITTATTLTECMRIFENDLIADEMDTTEGDYSACVHERLIVPRVKFEPESSSSQVKFSFFLVVLFLIAV